jgi:ribonuclease P protein component
VLHLNNLTSDQNPRIGFIVSKAVGNSVMRHRVTRQLRHLMMSRIDRLHRGDLAVVRALPNAAGLPSQELGIELDHLLSKVDRP